MLPNNAPARSKEVRNSEIRAHAARVGHLRHAKKLTRSRAKGVAGPLKLQLPVEDARHTLDRRHSQESNGGWPGFSASSNTSSSGEDDEIVLIEKSTNKPPKPRKYGTQETESICFVQLHTELDRITKMCRFCVLQGRQLLTIHSLASLRTLFHAFLQCFGGEEYHVTRLARLTN